MTEMAEYVSKIYLKKMETIKEEMENWQKIYENLPKEEPAKEDEPEEPTAKKTKEDKTFKPTLIQNEVPDVEE